MTSSSSGSSSEKEDGATGAGPEVMRAVFPDGMSSAVNLYTATNSSGRS